MDGFSNLNRNLPPIMTIGGGVKVYIVDPEHQPHEPIDIPTP